MLSEHPVRLSHYKWRKSKINSVLHLDISRVSRFRRSVKRRIILGQLQRRRIYCSRPYKDRLSVCLKGWSIVGIEEPSITLLLLQVCRESKSPSPTTTTSMCFCSNHPIRISEFVIDLLLAIAIFVMRFFFSFLIFGNFRVEIRSFLFLSSVDRAAGSVMYYTVLETLYLYFQITFLCFLVELGFGRSEFWSLIFFPFFLADHSMQQMMIEIIWTYSIYLTNRDANFISW